MRIALYQPDIPQNTGAILRLGACLGIAVDIIEPCGFPLDDRRLRRVAMDYGGRVEIARHASWAAFVGKIRPAARLILLTTRGETPYAAQVYHGDDTLIVGRESAGVPDAVHEAAAARVRVPMADGARALNVAVAASMVLGEALRQTGGFVGAEAAGTKC
jgi:tRNA (cytidine/uridine-2'-O-)-methyltransferase